MSLAPGTRLGAYEIVALIGAGGMGEVYRARDARLGRDVAIKVLPAAFSADADRLRRFEQEARAAAALNHPNILSVHDIGSQEGSPYVVSELLEGETLRARIGALPVRKACEYAIQIARGLAAAHEKGIVHRDLKPENIFVTEDGRVKILDFGLAKLTQKDSPLVSGTNVPTTPLAEKTEAGMVLGTIGYMAPEQVRSQPVDHRADVFAFGAMLYEMLSGQRAFHGETTIDTMTSILKEDPPDLPTVERHIPPALARIVDRCIEKSPGARFQSANDLAFALEGLSSDSGTTQAVPAIAPRRSRREMFLSLAAAALLLAAVGLSVVLYLASRPVEPLRVHALAPPPDGWSISNGAPPTRMAISPDGRKVAFVAMAPDRQTRLWVRHLESLEAEQVEGTDGGLFPFWSPDSLFLGFFAAGQLKKVQADGGPVLKVCDADTPSATGGATWSADNVIVFVNGPKGLHRVPASGGVPVPLSKTASASFDGLPYFLPDGRHFLYRTGAGNAPGSSQASTIFIASIDSDERREIAQRVSQTMYAQGHLLFVRDTTLMAQPFDAARLETTGDARPIVQNVLTGPGGNSAFSVSQNGVLAYLTGTAEVPSRLVWVDRKGAQLGVLGQEAMYGTVELSNSGTLAAVTTGIGTARDVLIFDLVRQFPTRFTFETGTEYGAIWAPDDTRLVFNSLREGRLDLFVKPLAGAVGTEQLLLSDDTAKAPFSWSPDGWIMYGTTGQDQNLLYMTVDGDKKPTPFVQTSFSEYAARFSPDGKWVAYRSNESGRSEVWIAPFPGPGKRTQVSTDGVGFGYPRWGRDGRELFFLDAGARLMAAAIDLQGPEARVGAVVPLFQSRARPNTVFPYDVASDGQRFLINMSLEENTPAATSIALLVNWAAGLKP